MWTLIRSTRASYWDHVADKTLDDAISAMSVNGVIVVRVVDPPRPVPHHRTPCRLAEL